MANIIGGGSIGGDLPFGNEPPQVAQLGRISGKLLNANLLRDGVDLAFETDLLYLDVNNDRIGINKVPTTYALEVDTQIRTNEFITDNSITVGDITLNVNNSITSLVNPIEVFVADRLITHDRLLTETLIFDDNRITTETNGDIVLDPSGSGIVNFASNTELIGNLQVNGNINLDGDLQIGGNIVLGDSTIDILTLSADFSQNLIPSANNTYDIGSDALRYDTIYLTSVDLDTSIIVPNFTISTDPSTISVGSGDITFVFPEGDSDVTVNKLIIGDDSLIFEGNLITGGQATGVSVNLTDTIENPNSADSARFSGMRRLQEVYGKGNTIEIQPPYLIVGASDLTTEEICKVFVFDLDSRTLLYQIDNPGTARTNRGFGATIRSNSQYIVVGHVGTGSSSDGTIHVFDITDGSLVRSIGANFGISNQIILTEDRIIAAEARSYNRVRVYDFSGTLIETITGPDIPALGDARPFGTDMAVKSGRLFITNPRAVNRNGRVYIYDLDDFSLLQTISNPNPFAEDYFGTAILVTDQYLIISTDEEFVYIFSAVDYSLIRTISNPNNYDTPAGDIFGWSLDLKENILAVGAPAEDDEINTGAGAVYLFDITTGSLLNTITNPRYDGNIQEERFGQDLAFYENLLFVSSPGDFIAGTSTPAEGVLHIFEIGSPILFRPNGSGEINLEANTNVGGNVDNVVNLTTTGNLLSNGSTVLGSSSSNNIRLLGEISSSIIPDTDITYDIGKIDQRWKDFYVDNAISTTSGIIGDPSTNIRFYTNTIERTDGLVFNFEKSNAYVNFDDITLKNILKIEGNRITSLPLNSGILFDPNGTGDINLEADTNVQGNVNVTEDAVATGALSAYQNVTFGNASSDKLTFNANIINSLMPNLDSTYNLGSESKSWKKIYLTDFVASSLLVGNISISSSPDTISSSTGNIVFMFSDPNSTVIFDSFLLKDNLKIQGNSISTTEENSNIVFNPNGSGAINLESDVNASEDFTISGNTFIGGNLSTAKNLIIGDQITDTVSITPDLTLSILPGIDSVFDLGRAADDSSPRYWGTAYISETSNIGELLTNSIVVSEQTSLDGTTATISTIQSNDDLVLVADSGNYFVDSEIKIDANTITNLNTTTPIILSTTGRGYVNFTGTNAMILPAGDTASRPGTPEVGDTRWNTDEEYLEIFNGTEYVVASGETGDITAEDIENEALLWSILLG